MTASQSAPSLRDRLTAACRIRWRGDNGTGHCPAHADDTPSLSVRVLDSGRVLAYCHAGCAYEAIRDALEREHGICLCGGERGPAPSHVATYTDPHGLPLYQVRRWDGPEGKRIRQYRADGRGGWTAGMEGVERTLYHMPEMVTARQVFIVEGEVKCDALRAALAGAAADGVAVTTAPGGAGKWRAEYSPLLAGRDVAVLADADVPGRRHAEQVAASVRRYAHRLRVIDLYPDATDGRDVADWLAEGHSVTELRELVRRAPEWRPTTDSAATGVGLVMAAVRAEPVRWLWPGRIPAGKLTVLDGDPGLGKSCVTLDLAARVSTGREMPDGSAGASGGVVLASAEDDPADTVRPRLDAAGANCERVLALRVAEYGTIAQTDVLRAAIERVGAALVVIDPLMAYVGLGRDVNSYRDQDVRAMLAPLAALAAETGAAILLVRHLRKSAADGNPLYRGGGSIGIIGAARSGLLAARDPDDPELRVLAVTKANLAREAPSMGYRLVEADGAVAVEWLGQSERRAAELLGVPASAEERGDLHDAVEWLCGQLAAGEAAAADLQRAARATGIAERTLWRAKRQLGVAARRDGGRDGKWCWSLPPKAANASKAANSFDLAAFAETQENTGISSKAANAAEMAAFDGLAAFKTAWLGWPPAPCGADRDPEPVAGRLEGEL